MATIEWQDRGVITELEGMYWAKSLRDSQISSIAGTADSARRQLAKLREQQLKDSPATIAKDLLAHEPEMGSITITIPATAGGWQDDVELTLSTIFWELRPKLWSIAVPTLNLEIAVKDASKAEDSIQQEVERALKRLDSWSNLAALSQIERLAEPTLCDLPLKVSVRSLREQEEEDDPDEKRHSELAVVARKVRSQRYPACELSTQVEQLSRALRMPKARSLLLVGPAGVGKTVLVQQTARERNRHGLVGRQFWQTSGSRIVAGMTGFGMWQERCDRLVKELQAKKTIILHVGNLLELAEVGLSSHNQMGIASYLKSAIGQGKILLIAEITPSQRPVLERRDPQLLELFTPITLERPSEQTLRSILLADSLARFGESALELDAVERIAALHERFAPYSASPARALGFMRRLVSPETQAQLTQQSVNDAFGRESGLPRLLLDKRVPMDRHATQAWFADRVIGQERAVDEVVNTIATVKAGMSRPGRPIATMIFIGPTGVGKTEMAKALSRFLFGSHNRLLRYDMSEYADSMAAERLIGGGNSGEGLLTGAIRETPFSIVLLDEFEKAHPRLFDLFLQVFDDGRLTDSVGRVADFCSSVIIMTSNLGVDSFGKPSAGFTGDSFGDSDAHFTVALQNFLRPEMVNRIDRIVPFGALPSPVVTAIAKHAIAESANRDGLRLRSAEMDVAPGIDAWIAARAYDPRYGARPVLRTITKELLAPLAVKLNSHSSDSALDLAIGLTNDRIDVTVKARQGSDGQCVSALTGSKQEDEQVGTLTRLRRDANCLAQHDYVCGLRNEMTECLHRRARKQQRGKTLPFDPRLQVLEEVLAEVAEMVESTNHMETRALRDLYSKRPLSEPDHASVRAELTELVLRILALSSGDKPEIHLALRCDTALARPLAAAYRVAAAALGAPCHTLYWTRMTEPQLMECNRYVEDHPDEEDELPLEAVTALGDQYIRAIGSPYLLCASATLGSVPEEAIEIVLRFTGRGYLLLRKEGGFHARVGGQSDNQVELTVTEARPEQLNPRTAGRPLRVYDVAKKEVRDAKSKRYLRWNGKDLAIPLETLLAENLARNVSDLLWQQPEKTAAELEREPLECPF